MRDVVVVEAVRSEDFDWRCVVGRIDTDASDYLEASMLGLPMSQWRRRGGTREPAQWFAWGEIAPSHGLTPTRPNATGSS